jgi:2-iminobutanoate/2-iminopropanoate deaminase
MNIISTTKAPAAIGPYSQAIASQGLLFTSGQISLLPETGQMVGATVTAQAQQCLANLAHVLRAGGADINTILKVTIFLINMDDFAAVNTVYEQWLGNHRPARSTVAVAGLPKNALVEIECVAHVIPV